LINAVEPLITGHPEMRAIYTVYVVYGGYGYLLFSMWAPTLYMDTDKGQIMHFIPIQLESIQIMCFGTRGKFSKSKSISCFSLGYISPTC
jgi:hypothetical protein